MAADHQQPIGGGTLRRLARDKRGNTLAMFAALMIPLLGMVGSGVDMARAYLSKAKLQTACDAAAIAARRVMGSAAFNDSVRDEGLRFFNFNFPQGTMGTSTFAPVVRASAADPTVVEVTAATTVPTTIMRLFGSESIPINVTCEADRDYVNNDIMMVLDVTGSMNCQAGTGNGCSYRNQEHDTSRMVRLRGAAVELYRALANVQGARIRYGFMPYSMTVNVGRNMQADWLLTANSYHTRTCTNPNGNGSWCNSGLGSNWNAQNINRTNLATRIASADGFCVEERSSSDQTTFGINATISSTVAAADIDTAGGQDRFRWQIYDEDATSYEQDAAFRANRNLAAFCPNPAQRLATFASETNFQDALEDAVGTFREDGAVGGYTNHDLGMIWGMRFLSGSGMFAGDNPDVFDATNDGVANPVRVDRHIVFLTDGTMTASDDNYSAFGIPAARRRMSGTGSEVDRHVRRFQNACNYARTTMGVTVWVIVLDVGDASSVRPCASSSSHFFVSDGTDLSNVFRSIGRGIGRLRLTQ